MAMSKDVQAKLSSLVAEIREFVDLTGRIELQFMHCLVGIWQEAFDELILHNLTTKSEAFEFYLKHYRGRNLE